jgi:hypothetical protein
MVPDMNIGTQAQESVVTLENCDPVSRTWRRQI